MKKICLVLLLGCMSLGAQQASDPALSQLRLENAQLKFENARLRMEVNELRFQIGLYEGASGINKQRHDDQQAVELAQEQLNAIKDHSETEKPNRR